jgi:hypothetical protein
MKRSDINPMPEYFDRYINVVSDVELSEAFDESIRALDDIDLQALERIGKNVYAADKWTVNNILQHVIDFERILSVRALLFARGDTIQREGVDEALLGANANADARQLKDLTSELRIVRLASKAMFMSFTDEMLLKSGMNWKYEVSVLAMGFLLAGHQIHHLNVIREKYLSLTTAQAV